MDLPQSNDRPQQESTNQEPQRDRKKRRCRSRLKSSSFPSQCWLDRSPCSGWPPCPATPRPSYHPLLSPHCSRPTLGLLRQWLAASDLPHLRHHQRISFWTSRRSKTRIMKHRRGREPTWTTSALRSG